MPTNPMRTKHIRNLPSPRVAPSPQKPTNVPYRERSDYCLHNNPNRVYTGKMTVCFAFDGDEYLWFTLLHVRTRKGNMQRVYLNEKNFVIIGKN